jgi:shikimate dehydrogenase
VVGNPVAHSLSPRIHAGVCSGHGQALTYETLLAPLGWLRSHRSSASSPAAAPGLNVTVPFKAQAAAWVDELMKQPAAAGAVNTIVRRPAAFAATTPMARGWCVI